MFHVTLDWRLKYTSCPSLSEAKSGGENRKMKETDRPVPTRRERQPAARLVIRPKTEIESASRAVPGQRSELWNAGAEIHPSGI